MRFFSAWVCGVCSAAAFVAWLDKNTTVLVFTSIATLIAFIQSMWQARLSNQVRDKAVKEFFKALKDKDSEVYKEFMEGWEQGVKDAMEEKLK